MNIDKLKYPIGKFIYPEDQTYNSEYVIKNIQVLKQFPHQLENEVKSLSKNQINTPYREGGWSILQLVHHMADSHIHAYIRCKYALIEDHFIVNDYSQEDWACLKDASINKYEDSILILKGLHSRWISLFENISKKKFKNKYYHLARKKYYSIYTVLGLYAWHCNHHLEHIKILKKNMNWYK